MDDVSIARSVDLHGWHAVAVAEGPIPTFVYTCGLMTHFDHPELLIFGLEPLVAHQTLSVIVAAVERGESYAEPGKRWGVLEDLPIAIDVVHPSHHEVLLGSALGHLRYMRHPKRLRAVQVFWPDSMGVLPSEEGCDPRVAASQPSLQIPMTPTERREWEESLAIPAEQSLASERGGS